MYLVTYDICTDVYMKFISCMYPINSANMYIHHILVPVSMYMEGGYRKELKLFGQCYDYECHCEQTSCHLLCEDVGCSGGSRHEYPDDTCHHQSDTM